MNQSTSEQHAKYNAKWQQGKGWVLQGHVFKSLWSSSKTASTIWTFYGLLLRSKMTGPLFQWGLWQNSHPNSEITLVNIKKRGPWLMTRKMKEKGWITQPWIHIEYIHSTVQAWQLFVNHHTAPAYSKFTCISWPRIEKAQSDSWGTQLQDIPPYLPSKYFQLQTAFR